MYLPLAFIISLHPIIFCKAGKPKTVIQQSRQIKFSKMKKIMTASAVLILVSVLTIIGCKKQDQQTSDANLPALSQKVTNDFSTAKSNWNTHVGNLVTLQSFAVSGRINTEADRTAIINKISADDAMAAYGNILDETTMQLSSIGELQSQNSSSKKTILSYLDKQVNVGDIIVDVLWQTSKKSFTSTCIVHNDAIAWDNLLTGVFMMNKTPKEELTKGVSTTANAKVYNSWYKRTKSWTTDWVFGGERGYMECVIKINCYSNGYVYSTDRSDYAKMSLGNVISESKTLVDVGNFGKIQYALGVSTPNVTLKMNWNNFSVSAEGLGSKKVANGTETLAPW